MDPQNEDVGDGVPADIEEAFAAMDEVQQKPFKGEAKAAKEKEKEESKLLKELHKMGKEKGPEPEDVAKHQEMIMTLTRWGSHPRFEQYLKDQGFTLTVGALKKKSLGDLQELEQRIRICIGARGQSDMMSKLAMFGVYFVECAATSSERFKMRFDITGVSDILKQNDTFLDAIAQLEMDYASYSSFGPKSRILIQMIIAMTQASNINKARRDIAHQAAAAMEALNNPQPAAPRQPIIPNQSGAHVEDDDEKEVVDRPMPSAATPA